MKKGIILASFGTTHQDTRERTIDVLENRITEEFPGVPFRRAFTSGVVIDRLKSNYGIEVKDLKGAMENLQSEGVTDIYIQPFLIIGGLEFEKILRAARDFMKKSSNTIVRVGTPLLWDDSDYRSIAGMLGSLGERPLVLMGHGSKHSADVSYDRLSEVFRKKGFDNIFLGSIEGSAGIDHVISSLDGSEAGSVTLKPFMLVAGDHVKNDMASDEEDSWKSILEENGYKVHIDMIPLGEMEKIQEMFLMKLKEVLIS
jgi:sirohydrochlorin cobaltochelatase